MASKLLAPGSTLATGARFTHYRYRSDAGPLAPGFNFVARSTDNDAFSGSVGLVYEPQPDLHLSANIASGYRQPNAQDLYFDGAASVGFVIGNPDLNPEKALSYDLGLRRVEVFIKGPGAGREAAVRSLQSAGLEITMIRDITPIPHNGCRPRKKRRV